jgi:steroid delta-isomerase-like uncharacterized protein
MTREWLVIHGELSEWYEAWNRRDWAAVGRLLADDFECEDVSLNRLTVGREAYLAYARSWAAAFPDARISLRRMVGTGGHAGVFFVEYSARGTQRGRFVGFEASHRIAELRYCDVLRTEHGKLKSCRTYGDLYRPLLELGHIASREAEKKAA